MIARLAALCLATLLINACGAEEKAASVPDLDTTNDRLVPGFPAGSDASWLSRPPGIASAAALARVGVIATVTARTPSEPIVAAPDAVTKTELITMRVRDRWFGETADEITLKWLEGVGGDPPYEIAQDYVLFLVQRSDGPWYRPESPDARLQIVGDRLRPVIAGPPADDVKDLSLAELKQLVTKD